jgi:hypothetical protein
VLITNIKFRERTDTRRGWTSLGRVDFDLVHEDTILMTVRGIYVKLDPEGTHVVHEAAIWEKYQSGTKPASVKLGEKLRKQIIKEIFESPEVKQAILRELG